MELSNNNNMNLTILNDDKLREINGGDGITEAVFYAIGYFVQSHADDQLRRHESGVPYSPGLL